MLIRLAGTDYRAPHCSTKALLNRLLHCGFAFQVSYTEIIIQHISNAIPHGTDRFKGTTALDKSALKSSPALRIRVSSKLHDDTHSTRLKYKSAWHGAI